MIKSHQTDRGWKKRDNKHVTLFASINERLWGIDAMCWSFHFGKQFQCRVSRADRYCWAVFVKLLLNADDAGTLWNLVELVLLLLLEHCEAFVKLVLVNYQLWCWNIVKLFRMQTFIIGSEVALAPLALNDVSKLKTFQFIEQRTQWHLHNCSFLCKVSNCLIFQIGLICFEYWRSYTMTLVV